MSRVSTSPPADAVATVAVFSGDTPSRWSPALAASAVARAPLTTPFASTMVLLLLLAAGLLHVNAV